jgi:hypothetical protein
MVTLGMWEHKVAFTKDISISASVWRPRRPLSMSGGYCGGSGTGGVEPTIFVTTNVNYGDKPEGCIAIAAVRETAERFGEGRGKVAWFLKNHTYVDDTRGGGGARMQKR